MDKNLLTIAIPTYNGADTIEKTICSVIKQTEHLPVEILVSDNCSTDDVSEVVKKFPEVSYFCNKENLGADGNISLCVERASCEYVLILGDDDVVKNGGVEKILSTLSLYRPAALFLNYQLIDIKNNNILKERWVDIKDDVVCSNGNEFVNLTGVSSNFLSSVVHSKKLFLSVDYKKLIGTNWVQFGTLLEYIATQKVACIASPVIENQGNSIEGEGNAEGRSIRIMLNMLDVIDNLNASHYSKSTKNLLKSNVRKFYLRKLYSAKRLGLKVDFKLFRELVFAFPISWRTFILEMPSLILPSSFHKSIYKVYKNQCIYKIYWKVKSFK